MVNIRNMGNYGEIYFIASNYVMIYGTLWIISKF